ncbi:dihydroorotase [Prochlorococcus marinus]|uniref:Dihydroorotase n=1 Tax=Prochlorococcus marinus (strain MIT 9211) TaxID=93059 RepID=A9BEJ4_PROM4|nr:Dihydroorotase [Prochlorococcus marinus str. MIT 9211]
MNLSQHQITFRQPDDWHLHLRDDELLNAVVVPSARVFKRAVVMPNLSPPITSIKSAIEYKSRILKALPKDYAFTPLMTAYLTDETSPDVLREGFQEGVFFAAKLYPANSTTNAAHGVSDISKINSTLEMMERVGIPLLIHGEVTDSDIDIFDREAVFIERCLDPLLRRFPRLTVVLEHITTEDAVEYVKTSSAKLGATITPHHLHINRNAMFQGGIRSDFYCLPIVKRERHRLALRRAVTSGEPCFFLGTDSAPHLRSSKESSCGCAGIFNALNAIESYAEVFEQEGAIEKLEAFASEFGPAFYGLPLNQTSITLKKNAHIVPIRFNLNSSFSKNEYLVPFHAGESLSWSISSPKEN